MASVELTLDRLVDLRCSDLVFIKVSIFTLFSMVFLFEIFNKVSIIICAVVHKVSGKTHGLLCCAGGGI